MSHEASMLQTPAPHTVPSTPPLMQRLVDNFDAGWVDDTSGNAFLEQAGDCVLFIAGDPVRFPECLDVAVVLPELQKQFADGFRIAVAVRESEDALARRYGATKRPSLVFLRDGQYVTTVTGMLDWDDYVRAVGLALTSPVSRVPGIGIPLVTVNSSSCS
ncbi:MAG: hydrogenase [Pseudomonadota bacterium]